ncbi:hypothetical protein AYO08_09830 [Pseudomonas putida]|uniref:hypothetical protein n=1 Tax=Pseudomonas TaxID=286 RepID=UPI0007DC0E9D|nr:MULTISPECIES: hypothetical protein [Pseudomonas]OAS07632.1 hypothetical protein AYO08_09830 [Pseudomonas putida]OOV91624.1 hypothetical protein MF6396_26400 [Pseudomonas sp. MF6396]
MTTIFGIIFGWFSGIALAGAFIAIFIMFDAGVELLGFTQITFGYYVVSLMLCVTMLAMSKPARRHLKFMGLFAFALFLVMAVGLGKVIEPVPAGDQIELMRAQAETFAVFLAQAVMYVVPGALALLYTMLAYNGVREERERNRVNMAG